MKARHIGCTLALAASLLGSASPSHAALAPGTPRAQEEVVFSGVAWLTGVKRAAITGRAWRAAESNVGGVTGKSYAGGYYPTAEFEFGINGAQALARKLTDMSAGRSLRLTTQVRRQMLAGDALEWTSLGECEVSYFEFPRLDAGSKSAGYFKLGVVPAQFTPMADKIAGTTAPPTPAATNFFSYCFSVAIPGVDCSHVTLVDGIAIRTSAAAAADAAAGGIDTATRSRSSGAAGNSNFTIQANGVTERGLRDWMLANQNTGPVKREITIQLLAPGTNAVLLTLHGFGVGLMSLRPEDTQVDVVRQSEAELFVERWEVSVPGTQKSALELVTPTLAAPAVRK